MHGARSRDLLPRHICRAGRNRRRKSDYIFSSGRCVVLKRHSVLHRRDARPHDRCIMAIVVGRSDANSFDACTGVDSCIQTAAGGHITYRRYPDRP